MKTSSIGMVVSVCAAVVGIATHGWAASAETKASRACRKTIASSFGKVASTGLGVIAKCHGSRDKDKLTGDCNDIAQADAKAKVAGAEGKATAAIAKKCAAGDPVLRNYESGDASGAFVPVATSSLQTTSTALLGAPHIVGDKAKVKCHSAIVKAEVADVNEILKGATKCQNNEDKLAETFGALDCVATAVKAGPKGEASIQKVCGDKQITGADVGSCDPLPGCVTQAATASGQAIAAAIYGQPRTTCQAGDQVKVVAALDATYNSATITLGYPAAVNIPGSQSAPSVAERVVFTPAGFPTSSDDDVNDDGTDDTVTASLLGFGDNAPGTFVTITFDCIPGQQFPAVGAFVCGVSSASDSNGGLIADEHCTLEVH